jgi:zinc transporter
MNEHDGLVCAYVLDGKGGGRQIDWSQLRARQDGILWVHLQRTGSEGRRWLCEESGLDSVVCDALLGDAAISAEQWIKQGRPRIIPYENGVTINFRGINLNPGADPNDMVSIRAWFDSNVVITVRQRHVMAIDGIRASIANGNGPKGSGDFVVMLAGHLVDRIADALFDLQDLVDEFEETIMKDQSAQFRKELGVLRRRAIAKRRHIVPQAEALLQLMHQRVSWIDERHRAQLGVIADREARHVEDLENLRERTAIIQDEIMTRLSEQVNRTMYILSVVAAIFLPVGFLTGLLGVNLGGIPGRDWEWAFWIVCAFFAIIAVTEVWLFRRWKLF